MKDTDTITVYWAPANYTIEDDTWEMLYASPQSLSSMIRKLRKPNALPQSIYSCPGYKDSVDNVFVFTSAIDDEVKIPTQTLEELDLIDPNKFPLQGIPLPTSNLPVSLYMQRPSSFDGYHSVNYNMGWILFADEPIVAKFTSPYFPPVAPAEGALLATGQFDIGSWYRPFNLDYHIPVGTEKLVFKEDDPLFYVEFYTTKKVVVKRYVYTKQLQNLSRELVESPTRYGKFKSLVEKYKAVKKTSILEMILSEIQKNVLE